MLHFRHISYGLLAALVFVPAMTGCANEHFFPRVRPLFPGLDEAHVPASARPALVRAKTDFQMARHGHAPQYARYAGNGGPGGSKVFEGNGYKITLVHNDMVAYADVGADIVIDPSITGGRSYHFDVIDRLQD